MIPPIILDLGGVKVQPGTDKLCLQDSSMGTHVFPFVSSAQVRPNFSRML